MKNANVRGWRTAPTEKESATTGHHYYNRLSGQPNHHTEFGEVGILTAVLCRTPRDVSTYEFSFVKKQFLRLTNTLHVYLVFRFELVDNRLVLYSGRLVRLGFVLVYNCETKYCCG